jgi:hypothetical protein
MRMRMYEVTLHYSGTETFYVEAPDEGDAVDVAHDELANMHQLDGLEVVDCESHEDGDPEGLY